MKWHKNPGYLPDELSPETLIHGKLEGETRAMAQILEIRAGAYRWEIFPESHANLIEYAIVGES